MPNKKWSELLAELKQHIFDFENGADYTIVDSGTERGRTLIVSRIKELSEELISFYRMNPQGDDRKHKYLTIPKTALDIDEVLADFLTPWKKRFNIKHVTRTWFFDHKIKERFDELKANNELNDFFLNLKPLVKPEEIPFEPHCYITSRPVDSEISRQWLDKHGFPMRPVYTVSPNETKVDVAIREGVEWFVDDAYHNFIELNRAGICCFLMNQPHNEKYDVGYKRIFSLKELIN